MAKKRQYRVNIGAVYYGDTMIPIYKLDIPDVIKIWAAFLRALNTPALKAALNFVPLEDLPSFQAIPELANALPDSNLWLHHNLSKHTSVVVIQEWTTKNPILFVLTPRRDLFALSLTPKGKKVSAKQLLVEGDTRIIYRLFKKGLLEKGALFKSTGEDIIDALSTIFRDVMPISEAVAMAETIKC